MTELEQTMNYSHLPTQPFLGLATEHLHDPDYVLARAAARGATGAVGDLYRRHSRLVYSLCLRMTRNASEAEDLTQEVFMQLLRKISSFRGDSQFTTWLYRLTVNIVLMHFRRVTRRKAKLPDEIAGELRVLSTRSARTDLLDRIALNSALAKLPSGCRPVFLLFDIEGYNHEEIANIRGCSVGNSKSQLHKARKKLRGMLQR